VGAALVHLLILFGIGFDSLNERYVPPALDVILVQPANDESPESASYLAASSQQGGGESETRTRPTAPFSSTENNNTDGIAAKPVSAKSPAEKQLAENAAITQIVSDHEIIQKEQQEQAKEARKAALDKIKQRELEVARLTEEIARDLEKQASAPRKMYVTAASTKKSTAAEYMLNWVRKVERVGNLNPPQLDDASGSLVMVVGINQHGTVTDMAIKRSSGRKSLDDAALGIVRQAAPFDRMSPALANETDIIYITRTWQFNGDQTLTSY